MRILVACEFSGRVRDAFTARGHDAISCDLLPSETPGPHIVGDVLELLETPTTRTPRPPHRTVRQVRRLDGQARRLRHMLARGSAVMWTTSGRHAATPTDVASVQARPRSTRASRERSSEMPSSDRSEPMTTDLTPQPPDELAAAVDAAEAREVIRAESVLSAVNALRKPVDGDRT